jgi:hypothetical protein
MISTNLGKLIAANKSIAGNPSPLGSLMGMKMPVRLSWQRLALFEAIEEQLTRHSKMEIEIFKRYSDKTGPGGAPIIEPTNPKISEAALELQELASMTVELDHEPIGIDDLTGDLSAADLRSLRDCGIIVK